MRFRPGAVAAALALGLVLPLGRGGGGEAAAEAPAEAPRDEPLRVETRVDRARLAPGETATLTFVLDWADGVAVEVPEFGAAIAGPEVVEQATDGPRPEGGRHRVEKRYAVTADAAGTYVVPPVPVPYTLADGTPGEARTGQVLIEFAGPDAPGGREGDGATVGEGLRDIAPPIAPDPDLRWLAWVAGAVAAALALAGLAYGWARRRRIPEAPPPPPHEVALRDLDRLLRSDLLATGRQKEFAFRLSEVLRRYLEDRFGFPAVESTTEELLGRLPQAAPELGAAREEAVRATLSGADLVKFAEQVRPAAEVEGWARAARRLVEDTVPLPEPEGPARAEVAVRRTPGGGT